jgi:hypothetical protein
MCRVYVAGGKLRPTVQLGGKLRVHINNYHPIFVLQLLSFDFSNSQQISCTRAYTSVAIAISYLPSATDIYPQSFKSNGWIY